jgi:hemolysin III
MGDANDHISAWIHLLSAAGFLIASPQLLARLGADPLRRLGGAVHVFGIVFLLVMSGTFHLLSHLHGKESATTEAFRQLDHIGVWTMMGAFHTLPILLLLRGAWRWVSLGVMWSAALTGIAVKTIWWGMFSLEESFVLYTAAAMVGVVVMAKLIHQEGLAFLRPLFAFWACFIVAAAAFVGAPPDLIPGVIGQHEIWHLGISLGTVFHWHFVLREATRTSPETPSPLAPAPELLPAGR